MIAKILSALAFRDLELVSTKDKLCTTSIPVGWIGFPIGSAVRKETEVALVVLIGSNDVEDEDKGNDVSISDEDSDELSNELSDVRSDEVSNEISEEVSEEV